MLEVIEVVGFLVFFFLLVWGMLELIDKLCRP